MEKPISSTPNAMNLPTDAVDHLSMNIHRCLLTHSLTYSKEKSPSGKQTADQLVKKFPAFYRTRRFITTIKRPHHLSLSRTRSIQPMPQHPTSCKPISIFSSHLLLCLASGLFPNFSPTKSCIHLSSPS